MRVLYIVILTFFNFSVLMAQEFSIDVKVQAPGVQTNDRQIFSNLETALRNFINQQAWTKVSFEDKEKIINEINLKINSGGSCISQPIKIDASPLD